VLVAENIPVTILRIKTLLCITVIGTVTVIIIEFTIIIDPISNNNNNRCDGNKSTHEKISY